MLAIEAAYQRRCDTLLVPRARLRELVALRLPLTRFETEVIELESRDAAQEALFCVREDGMSMEEVAVEGHYPYRHVDFLLEDIPIDVQQRFHGISAGDVLEPVARGDGFELCRVMKKIEPQPDDPRVKSRVDQRLLERHFSELISKYVQETARWRLCSGRMKIQDSEILRRSSVFRFLSDEHFGAIEPLLQEEHYEFGDVIVKQDDPADSFYVLTRGRARALKIKPDGEEIPLGVLKPGDSFGEAALSEGGTRNATVRCSTAVRCFANRSRGFSRVGGPSSRHKTFCRDHRAKSCAAKLSLSIQQFWAAADGRVAQRDRHVKTCRV